MEARSSNEKAEPDKREKREIKQEATASSSEVPPLEDEEEPPPLEEVSEPHSKASTPRISSPLYEDFEKGNYSPLSDSKKDYSPSPLYTETESPSSYTENARSPSPYTQKPHIQSPHIDNLRPEGVENNTISAHYVPPPKLTDTNNSQTKAGIGSNTTTVPIEKVDTKSSMRSSIPSITHSVISAAKHVSFKSRSLSSRSSTAIYGSSSTWWKGSPHQMKIVEVALRFGGAVLALITFSVMAATSETERGAGSTFTMKFTDYPAYNYLVAVNVISFVYSCLQLVLLGQSRIGGFFTTTRDNTLFTYVCDQVLAFLLFSASTAAATAAQLSRHGLHNIWPPACSTWKLWLFCAKADAAVVMGFFSSFFVIASSVFSGYHVSHPLLE